MSHTARLQGVGTFRHQRGICTCRDLLKRPKLHWSGNACHASPSHATGVILELPPITMYPVTPLDPHTRYLERIRGDQAMETGGDDEITFSNLTCRSQHITVGQVDEDRAWVARPKLPYHPEVLVDIMSLLAGRFRDHPRHEQTRVPERRRFGQPE